MSARNFNTQNDTYRQLMGNGLVYRVPRFQRDYSWDEDEWEDLWQDLLGTIKEGGEPAHYMGYLVLQSVDEKTFDVIDGQQRLTTLSLIVIAALKHLQRLVDGGHDAENNKARLDQLRRSYIGFTDPVTLLTLTKLRLNRNNDQYFQNYIVAMQKLPQRGFKASEHQLRKSFEWFDRRMQDYLKTADGDKGKALAGFIETMSDRLFFTVITVTDELNAFKVFETLNARGVRLSSTDLLKNYLFSVLHREGRHEQEMENLEGRWERMIGWLGSESFPDFLRIHWNSRKSLVRQSELFKEVRRHIQDSGQAFALIREMEEDIENYLILTEPEGAKDCSAEVRRLAQALKTFNVRQPYSILLAAKRRFSDGDFERFFRAIVIASFRYNVIGSMSTAEQERVYSQGATQISRGDITTVGPAIAHLAPVYPSDASFKAAFSDKVIPTTERRNKRVVRYILCALERQLTQVDHDFASPVFDIEHIMPQNIERGYEQFSDSQAEAMCHRLGNMTLIEENLNKLAGNLPYPEKRVVYS